MNGINPAQFGLRLICSVRKAISSTPHSLHGSPPTQRLFARCHPSPAARLSNNSLCLSYRRSTATHSGSAATTLKRKTWSRKRSPRLFGGSIPFKPTPTSKRGSFASSATHSLRRVPASRPHAQFFWKTIPICSTPVTAVRPPKITSSASTTRRQSNEALDRLQPPLREVLLLCDVEELKYKDIALVLDVPIGTVMSRISRARRALHQLLQSQLGESL